MNSFNKGVLFAGSMGLVLSGTAFGQNLFNNQGFESGTFASGHYQFAQQQAHGAGNTGTGTATTGWSISGWSFSSGNNGQVERWINDNDSPNRASEGSRYVYLSTTTTSGSGNACLLYTSGGGLSFTAGTTYQFSFYAADAGSTGGLQPKIGFEVQGGGGPDVIQTTSLPLNGAWSDSAESTIPWVQYTFNWTASANYSNPNFYWSVFSGGAGSTGSVVLDNVSLTVAAVPEAHTVAAGIFMAGLVGTTIYRRRKAQA